MALSIVFVKQIDRARMLGDRFRDVLACEAAMRFGAYNWRFDQELAPTAAFPAEAGLGDLGLQDDRPPCQHVEACALFEHDSTDRHACEATQCRQRRGPSNRIANDHRGGGSCRQCSAGRGPSLFMLWRILIGG